MNTMFKAVIAAGLLAAVPGVCGAQGATQPIRLVVPFPAGGPSDVAARALAQAWTASAAQPVVVDNRPGAGGVVAAQAVLGAPADGRTLFWAPASAAAMPLLAKASPYKSLLEMAPLGMVARLSYTLAVHPGLKAQTMDDLVRAAKAQPGKLTYATGSLGEYITTVQFAKAAGIDILRVPYKGGSQAMPDLLAGRVDMFITALNLVLPHAKEGKLKMLATVLPKRSSLAPEVPTMAELGMANVTTPTWQAVFATPGTPREVQAKLGAEMAAAMRNPEFQTRLEQMAMVPDGLNGEGLARVVREDFAAWKAFVQDYSIPAE